MISLAMVATEFSEPGTEVTLVWGEENGGSSKPTVERHIANGNSRNGCCPRPSPRLRASRIGHVKIRRIRWHTFSTKTNCRS